MTAADKYYLKAKEYYPYDMDEVLECLDYGLSHDETHAGLLVLKGKIAHCDLRQFDVAREYYELALYHDAQFVDAYYNYIKLLCELDEAKVAEQLIVRALTVKGIDKARIWHLEALMYEKQGMYTIALASVNNALNYCQDKELYSFYKDEMKRIKKKGKATVSEEEPQTPADPEASADRHEEAFPCNAA